MAQRTIPVIATLPELTQWRSALTKTIKKVPPPKVPWNFQVVSKQGGNYLTWQVVSGADGYELDISTTGDFSTGVNTVALRSQTSTAYFDEVPTSGGATPAQRWYRIRATSGTATMPHSTKGVDSGVVSSTAIAPNDTVTAPVTSTDVTTVDKTQRRASLGRYRTVDEA